MENEKCIICHRETNIPCDTPIELRDNYIEGAGQLCPECALRLIRAQQATEINKIVPEYRPYLKER